MQQRRSGFWSIRDGSGLATTFPSDGLRGSPPESDAGSARLADGCAAVNDHAGDDHQTLRSAALGTGLREVSVGLLPILPDIRDAEVACDAT
jgi:hypothetical protein